MFTKHCPTNMWHFFLQIMLGFASFTKKIGSQILPRSLLSNNSAP